MADTQKMKIADVVKWETNPNFTREKVTLKAVTTQTIVVGSPLRDDTGYILVANGQEANATHIALENIDATGGEECLALRCGPALIDKDQLTLETGVTWSELESYFAALDIRALAEPAEYEEGLETGL